MAQRPRMRPEFMIAVGNCGPAVMARLQEQLAGEGCALTGQVVGDHACLALPPSKQSLLSPYLNLDLQTRDGAVRLRGRFGPRPNVWTGFMAVYGVLAMGGLTGGIYGWAQTTVHEFPWGFFGVPAALALIAFVYGAAIIGQGLTADEMYELRAFVDEAVHAEVGPDCRELAPGD